MYYVAILQYLYYQSINIITHYFFIAPRQQQLRQNTFFLNKDFKHLRTWKEERREM